MVQEAQGYHRSKYNRADASRSEILSCFQKYFCKTARQQNEDLKLESILWSHVNGPALFTGCSASYATQLKVLQYKLLSGKGTDQGVGQVFKDLTWLHNSKEVDKSIAKT